jgi:hypothetical protein
MRRLMLLRALLYESIEDLKYEAASFIRSSPVNSLLDIFPERISNETMISYQMFPKELRH